MLIRRSIIARVARLAPTRINATSNRTASVAKPISTSAPTPTKCSVDRTFDYRGGYWQFYALSNGGFYLAPDSDRLFPVVCENGYEGNLSADALGITACLYAYSHLSFAGDAFAETCARQFHWPRDYTMEHPEARDFLRAID